MTVKVKFESFNDGTENVKLINNSYIFDYPCTNTTYCKPYEITLSNGRFLIELCGSQGGDAREWNQPYLGSKGGLGAYTRGILTVHNKMTLYLYLGAKGQDQSSAKRGTTSLGGWNFGGDGGNDPGDDPPESGAGGGGGVDIRLIPVDTDTKDETLLERSIISRIMCAGGGALSYDSKFTDPFSNLCSKGMPGGTTSATTGYPLVIGGNQTKGDLGKGANGYSYSFDAGCATGGSGSGYRGGYHIIPMPPPKLIMHSGAGGSSYISGHKGCISPDGGNEFHQSGVYFTETDMLSGNDLMPQPNFTYGIGHAGNGAARITILYLFCFTQSKHYNSFRCILLICPIIILDDK